MPASVPVIRPLNRTRCLELLAGHTVGRVATVVQGVPHVVPVNYVLLDGDVVFRSGTGTKLHAALSSQPVSFEVDRVDERRRVGWSVLVSGRAEVLDDGAAADRPEVRGLEAWAPGRRDRLVRVRAELVSGREITRP